MKRVFDIACSLAGLILLGWLILLLVWQVRRDSPGDGLFRQTRIGQNERPFTFYKLRTMRTGTAHAASHETPRSAVTALGARLRRTKLDELPQLWNVLKGDMSLVGPRPCLPTQSVLLEERRRLGVFALKPGITGPAQVAGIDMSDPVRLAQVDARYLGERSLAGDIALIVQTVLGRGRGDRVGD